MRRPGATQVPATLVGLFYYLLRRLQQVLPGANRWTMIDGSRHIARATWIWQEYQSGAYKALEDDVESVASEGTPPSAVIALRCLIDCFVVVVRPLWIESKSSEASARVCLVLPMHR